MDGLHDAVIRGKRRFEARDPTMPPPCSALCAVGEPCSITADGRCEAGEAPPNEPRACWICDPGPCLAPKECAR